MASFKQNDQHIVSRWLDSQRGRPQYRAAPHASKAVSRIMRPLSKKHGGGHTGLSQYWEEIVGKRLSAISKPLRIQVDQNGRSLMIGAPGPAAALIMASSGSIISKVNAYLGSGFIVKIKVIQTKIRPHNSPTISQGLSPKINDELQSGLSNIADPDLKQVLKSFGQQVLSHTSKT